MWLLLFVLPIQAAGLEKGPSAVYCLPVMDFSGMHLLIQPEWHLASGRHPDDHHLFPNPVPVSSQT